MGQVTYLSLRATPGYQPWDVAPPDGTVLEGAFNPAAAAARGYTLRAFRALTVGGSTIAGDAQPVCAPSQSCAATPQAPFPAFTLDSGAGTAPTATQADVNAALVYPPGGRQAQTFTLVQEDGAWRVIGVRCAPSGC